ncbi:MAG: biotin carboxylase N-terminal domain-containing protein [Candidatus Thermoplasmatota archaeon]
MFRRVLIANRGEIAIRVARTCWKLGVQPVGVYSEADTRSLHRRFMAEDVCIGPAPPADSYLVIDKIVNAASDTNAEAIHPGYGFLAENPQLPKRCEEEDLAFVGPPANAMALSGDKIASRKVLAKAGIPVTKGVDRVLHSVEEAREVAGDLGYPVLFKATGGGGGIGMSRVDRPDELPVAFESSQSLALANFGNPDVFLEHFVERARHIEIQVLLDGDGGAVHLGERECSVQRRHQKLIEESPSPVVTPDMREEIGERAVRALRTIGYRNAGTVEFLFANGGFTFNEVNARLQVEHPVTEMTTGLDLVELQLRIAAGEAIPFGQDDVVFRGHAMECRINAEDPRSNFAPGPGRILEYREPSGPGVRVDAGVSAGSDVSEHYDPLIAKLIIHAGSRGAAITGMGRALRTYRVVGVPTTIPFHRVMLRDPNFQKGRMWTTMAADLGILERLAGARPPPDHVAALALAIAARPHVAEVLAERRALRRPFVSRWTGEGRTELLGGYDAISARRQR